MQSNLNDPHRYDDIIYLPHHVSAAHPQMNGMNRAAQFAPFAALNGYEDAIAETQRITNQKIEMDENRAALLDAKFQMLAEQMNTHPEVKITHFVPDEKKEGGTYIEVTGRIRKVDSCTRSVVMIDGTSIPFHQILEIESQIFGDVECW